MIEPKKKKKTICIMDTPIAYSICIPRISKQGTIITPPPIPKNPAATPLVKPRIMSISTAIFSLQLPFHMLRILLALRSCSICLCCTFVRPTLTTRVFCVFILRHYAYLLCLHTARIMAYPFLLVYLSP